MLLNPTLQSKPQAHAKEAQTEVPAAEAIFDFESKEAAEKELLMLRNAALLSWRVRRGLNGFIVCRLLISVATSCHFRICREHDHGPSFPCSGVDGFHVANWPLVVSPWGSKLLELAVTRNI